MGYRGHLWVNFNAGKGWKLKYFLNEREAQNFVRWCYKKGIQCDRIRYGGTYW